MFQMRKPHKTPAEKLGDMETSNLPKKEFRVMIAWMTKEPTRRMDSQSEKSDVSKKEFKNIKNNQTEMKNTVTEMKNILCIHSSDFLFVCLMLGLFFHETLALRQPLNLRGPVPL